MKTLCNICKGTGYIPASLIERGFEEGICEFCNGTGEEMLEDGRIEPCTKCINPTANQQQEK